MKKLYIMRSDKLNCYKIGISVDPVARRSSLSSTHDSDIKLIYTTDFVKNPIEVERLAHECCKGSLLNGREWFSCSYEQAVNAVEYAMKYAAVVDKDFDPHNVDFRYKINGALKFTYMARNIEKTLKDLVNGAVIKFNHHCFYGYEFQIVAKKKEVK